MNNPTLGVQSSLSSDPLCQPSSYASLIAPRPSESVSRSSSFAISLTTHCRAFIRLEIPVLVESEVCTATWVRPGENVKIGGKLSRSGYSSEEWYLHGIYCVRNILRSGRILDSVGVTNLSMTGRPASRLRSRP